MPRPTPSTIAAILTATLLSTTLALAQEEPQPVHPTAVTGVWPTSNAAALKGLHLILVTNSEPGKRQRCQVQSLDQNQIVCSRQFGRMRAVYPQQDVVALIDPARHTPILLYVLGCAAAGAGTITGAVFLASISIAGAVPLALIGGALILLSPLLGMAADEDGDHGEYLRYLAPGQTLHVKLRD